jgi:NADH-quinone oxidoreductase subunit L
MGDGTNIILLYILLLPLLSGAASYFLFRKKAGITLVFFSTALLVLSLVSFSYLAVGTSLSVTWFAIGNQSFEVGLYYDALAGIMLIVVAIVALLVAIFSLEYMKHDEAKARYFSLLGLFAFSMYGIVLSSNLLLTFVFWELVGFSSYLLIGFWFEKAAPPISSFKAFLMNKIGDVGFLLGIFILFSFFKTLDIQTLLSLDILSASIPHTWLIVMGLGLFLAAVGKSAQFPLQTWLPDAMSGPTPVSALIHAATMVAAGVYLMVRLFPLLAPEVLTVIGVIGGVTAFMGAFAAFAQNDIKKILAYSTVSQLGYMIMAIGAGFPLAAFFHLTTHAFFKAGLFLCAGSIIHYYHETRDEKGFDAQDITNMGGLKTVLPYTNIAFILCMLSLAGLPLFSGFLSKEMILNGLASATHLPTFVVVFGFASVFMTAAYMGRLYFKVFFGTGQSSPDFSEALTVKWPLIFLSVLSLGIVFSWNPLNTNQVWLIDVLRNFASGNTSEHSMVVLVLSVGLSLGGLLFSYLYIEKKAFVGLMKRVKVVMYKTSNQNFYLDTMYQLVIVGGTNQLSSISYWLDKRVIDRFVNLVGETEMVVSHLVGWLDKYVVDGLVRMVTYLAKAIGNKTRGVQGGNLQSYLTWAVFGILIFFYFLN